MPKNPIPLHVHSSTTHVERIFGIAPDDQLLNPESTHIRLPQEGYPITLNGTRCSLGMGKIEHFRVVQMLGER